MNQDDSVAADNAATVSPERRRVPAGDPAGGRNVGYGREHQHLSDPLGVDRRPPRAPTAPEARRKWTRGWWLRRDRERIGGERGVGSRDDRRACRRRARHRRRRQAGPGNSSLAQVDAPSSSEWHGARQEGRWQRPTPPTASNRRSRRTVRPRQRPRSAAEVAGAGGAEPPGPEAALAQRPGRPPRYRPEPR